MFVGNKVMIFGAVLAFSASSVYAGPCNTASRDAGSGNVPGYVGQTTGSAATESKEHPPTSAMNKAAENTAMSSEDAKRQMQSQATAADQANATKSAPSEQSKMTAGTAERTEPAPSEQSKQATAGAAQPAPSGQTVGEQGC